MATKYYRTPHLVYDCKYHVIFCPKYRRRILVNGLDELVKTVFRKIAEQKGFQIIEMEVMPDHVHLIIDCNPRFGVMDCVNRLKGISSRRLREQFPHLKTRLPTLWTRSAFISSVGSVSLAAVQKYIENQKNR